jgi:general secretion pathway protein J
MTLRLQRGFTLMEVLIAVSLLSLISVGILTTLRMGLSALEKTNRKLISNRRVTGAQRALEAQVANFMPVIAQVTPGFQAPPERIPFFQGEPQSMRFVSSYSLQEASRGYPRILELQVIPREEGDGVRLVVNEHLYTGPLGAGLFILGRHIDPITGAGTVQFRPIEIGPGSFVLTDRLAFCRFSYLTPPVPPDPETWTAVWTRPGWPRAVRVEMAPLDEDAAQLRPTAMTAPIHVDRTPIFDYADN